jgi:hypothetical protein
MLFFFSHNVFTDAWFALGSVIYVAVVSRWNLKGKDVESLRIKGTDLPYVI